jgi:ceramide glucosyltransferase
LSGALGLGLLIWLGVAFVYRVLSLRALDGAVRSESCGAVQLDGEIALLRPLRGAGAGLEGCLESLWRAAGATRTPVVVGFAEKDDPAGAVVARVRDRHPEVWAETRVAPGPAGRNRKMANLIQMTEEASAEFFVMTDADVRVPVDYVARMLGAFKDSAVGLVTCLYRSVAARSLASRLDALVTNTHFLPGVASSIHLEGLHLALGASIAVRREALNAAGGFEALLEVAADDFVLARNLEAAGWRLAWEPFVVDHVLEDEGWLRAARRHLRWSRVAREVRPGGYLGQLVTHGAIPALALALTLGGLASLAPFAWWGVELAELWRRRETLGLRARDLALVPGADVLAFASWAGGVFGRATPS